MKTTFNIVDDILFKKPDQYTLTNSDEFSPYMVQRWASMESPEICTLLNSVYNQRQTAFPDNQMVYDYLKALLPKKRWRKLIYFKKEKKVGDASKEETALTLAASVLELSKAEIREMLEIFPNILDEFKEETSKVMKKSKMS